MKKTIHEKLIEVLKLHTPEGENAVNTLISLVPMSKEAAYRRLRGEIQFTLTEASRISEKLFMSIDKMVGIDKNGYHMFHIKEFFTDEPFEKYYDQLQSSLSIYKQLKKDPNAVFYFAGNTFLHPFCFKYKFLSRYYFFKWFYQTSYTYGAAKQLEEVVIPQKIIDIQKELFSESLEVNSCSIIGDDIILSLINDLKYFAAIDLIKPHEIDKLKEDLFSMLDDVENTTKDGVYLTTGKKALTYISNAYFDANYSYLSGTNFSASSVYLYGINQLSCIDPVICEHQKLWIDSLIAYSTLISGSGKLQGTLFFNQQRELLNSF